MSAMDWTLADPSTEFTGEGLGYTGFDSGLDAGTLDAGLGDLSLNYEGGFTDSGVSDPTMTLLDGWNLAGNTETPPDPNADLGFSDNGAGSAGSQPGTGRSISLSEVNTAIGAFGKFGSSLASLFTGHAVATVGGQPVGAAGSRVIRMAPPKTTSSHTVLVLAVAGLLVAGLVFSGD